MIVWDVDGVLLDTFDERGQFRWSVSIEKDLGVPDRLLPHLFSGRWNEALRGLAEERDCVRSFFEAFHLSASVEAFLDYWLSRDLVENHAVCKHLSAVDSCLATNQTKLRAEEIQRVFTGRTKAVFASCHLHALKPEPAFFERIEDTLGLRNADLCLIDDTRANIQAALARGWQAHFYRSADELDRFLAEKPA